MKVLKGFSDSFHMTMIRSEALKGSEAVSYRIKRRKCPSHLLFSKSEESENSRNYGKSGLKFIQLFFFWQNLMLVSLQKTLS